LSAQRLKRDGASISITPETCLQLGDQIATAAQTSVNLCFNAFGVALFLPFLQHHAGRKPESAGGIQTALENSQQKQNSQRHHYVKD
jgi:hypothetical protein